MKNLVRIECDCIRVFRLKKGNRQMVSVSSRLYRMDDRYMFKDARTDSCYIIYDIDETQPYQVKPEPLDPDMTRAFIDSAKLAGNKKSIWANLNPSRLWQYLTVAIVAGALLYGFLVNGGF